ncbi:MAG: hypothetical protein FWD11_12255 [Micrococcales bacterium]|nr:hypothetical protein [Micrococcales bacterium]
MTRTAVLALAALLVVTACDTAPGTTGPAASPQAAARGFLDAVSDGRVDDALSFLRVQPTDRTLLTDDVLDKAALPITHITTSVRGGAQAQRAVDVSYVLDGQRVTDTYQTVRLGGRWFVDEVLPAVPAFVDRPDFAQVTVDGSAVQVPVGWQSGTQVLPGRYRFAVDHPLLDVDNAEFVVTSLHAPAVMAGVPHTRLTDAGRQQVAAAAAAALDSCLAATTLRTCGFGVGPDHWSWKPGSPYGTRDFTLVENTATWTLEPGGTDLQRTEPQWQYCQTSSTVFSRQGVTTVCVAVGLLATVRMSARTTRGTTEVFTNSVFGYRADITDPDHIRVVFR